MDKFAKIEENTSDEQVALTEEEVNLFCYCFISKNDSLTTNQVAGEHVSEAAVDMSSGAAEKKILN